jgi:hypothetical protein
VAFACDSKVHIEDVATRPYKRKNVMRKVVRGFAKDRDGNLILMGTITAPHSKYKASPEGTSGQKRFDQARRNNLQERNCPLVSPRAALLLSQIKNLAEAETDIVGPALFKPASICRRPFTRLCG